MMWITIVVVSLVLSQGTVKVITSKIDPEVSKALKNGGNVNVIISFIHGIKPALDRTATLRSHRGGDWGKRNQAVVDALRSNADNAQKGVSNILSVQARDSGSFKSFKKYWSCNVVFVEQASADIIQTIAKDPDVKQIKMERDGMIPETGDDESSEKEKRPTVRNDEEVKNWGLTHMEVLKAWEELGGNKGEGVVVGTIDSGVRHTHEALRDNFIGSKYGWYDPFAKSPEPFSLDAHGTNTLGILAGSKGVGVAPGAKWMTCISCNATACPGEALLDCMQFMSCPTLPDGSNPDCSKAPRVVSNSWVTAHGVTYFNDQTLAWRAQGIIPVFAIGNEGVDCRKVAAPGELPWVIGVGGVDYNNLLFKITSVGPAADGGKKPDIIAPSVEIRVAHDASDTRYKWGKGTSMACPHVAGVIALLLVRDPNMTYEEAYDIITSTAGTNVIFNKYYVEDYCKEGNKDEIPNIYFGYGQIHALRAIQEQTKRLEGKSKTYFVVSN